MTKPTKKLTKRQKELKARRERQRKIIKLEQDLIEKYGLNTVKRFKAKYDKAFEMLLDGDIVEENEGEEIAQAEYYNEAEEIMAKLPEDYKEFREFLMEW